jgi:hypothetical protein
VASTKERKAGRAAIGYLAAFVFVMLDKLGKYLDGRFTWKSALATLLAVHFLLEAVDRFKRWRAARGVGNAPGAR